MRIQSKDNYEVLSSSNIKSHYEKHFLSNIKSHYENIFYEWDTNPATAKKYARIHGYSTPYNTIPYTSNQCIFRVWVEAGTM